MPRILLEDFSGGITDSIYTSPINCAEVADNILIRKDKTAETAPGVEIFSPDASRVPSNKRIALLMKLSNGSYVAFSNARAYYVTTSSITELTGPTGNKAFNLGDENSIVSADYFNNQIHAVNDAHAYEIKIYIDDNGDPQLRTAGLPVPASDPTITSAAGSNAWLYAFVYKYEYRVGTTLFIDRSTPRYVQKTSMALNVSISGIPVVSNGADFNWDTSNIKVEIYRSVNNGTALYYVGEVTNGTTIYTDSTSDATLITNEPLYTNGGIQPNDMPDPSKYLFEANDTYYKLNILQDTEEKPFRLKQSITGDPDSNPDDFIVDFKAPLVGGSAVGRNPIILTENQTIRLEGVINEAGQGSVVREVISNTVGGVSHNGIIKNSRGIYFAGTDGFYFTDGFSTPTKLAKKDAFTSKLDKIYPSFTTTDTQKKRIQGVYDPYNNRAYWTVQENESDNDKIYVYDETHDSFTTLSNSGGILPTALVMDGSDVIIGDSRGYLFRMSFDYFTTPVVDTTVTPSDWDETAIIYRWKSVMLTGGDGSINKWFTKINVQGTPETNVNMAILSYTNGEDTYKELYPVRVAPAFTWGDPDFTWGDDSFIWNRVGTLNQTRRFSAGRLRARQRQIEFTNAYYTILSSTEETESYITVNAGAKLAVLVTPSSYSFGSNNEGYDMIIDGVTYEILSGTSDTITLSDPNGELVNGTYPWSIKGYGKGQRAHILNCTVEFEPLSDAGTQWRGGSTT
jgi:hypothetical protein